MTKTETKRTGRVLIRAGWMGDRWEYRDVAVREDEDGSLYYYHGGPTCCTKDGYVSLPEEYHDRVVWDR